MRPVRRMSRLMVGLAVACIAVVASLAPTAVAADPNFGITAFTAQAVQLLPDGTGGYTEQETTQAGAHPDALVVDFHVTTETSPTAGDMPTGNVKDVEVELPPGIYGNALATPRCTMVQYRANACTRQSIVGFHVLEANSSRGVTTIPSTVYNLVPPKGTVARFAFNVLAVDVMLDMKINSDGRYTLSTNINDISEVITLISSHLTLFGVPADWNGVGTYHGYGTSGGGERSALLTLGSQCGPAKPVTLTLNSWQDPARWLTGTYTPATPTEGCEKLSFGTDLSMRPDSSRAGVPSGFTARLSVPQNLSPDGLATPPVRRVVTTLPEGVAVSPASAHGLVGCTDEQAALRSLAAPSCPSASRIGSVRIDTPVLSEPLAGGVFLGKPKSMNAQSGQMLRIFLIAQAQGVTIKQEGRITPDPVTGRLRAVFDEAPQLPFSALEIHFNDGPQAPLTNPTSCGTYTTSTDVTAWSGQVAHSTSSFAITQNANGQACSPLGFAPTFQAGTKDPVAGAFSPLTVTVARSDGMQELRSIESVALPEGLLGMVGSVPLCGAADAARGSCPVASRVGHVDVAAGSGAFPLWIPQAGRAATGVYLTGPYKGAPYGLSIVVPAQAGPFDLGTVVVRSALHIDPEDAHVTALTDPLPRILQGIPLQIRQVRLVLDRAGFTFNPTSCAVKQIRASLVSAQGARADLASRFQVGECGSLRFSPVVRVQEGGKRRTARYEHPGLHIQIRQPAKAANFSKANVVLPRALNIDLKSPALKAACAREVYAKDQCSKTATVGVVRAVTPVFREALTGPVFLLQKKGQLPDLVMRLRNSHYSIDLIGVLDFLRDGRVIARVSNIPDAPISRFDLSIHGGQGGSLLNRKDLCAHRRGTQATFKGQNGKVVLKTPRNQTLGCKMARARTRKAVQRRAADAARTARARVAAARGGA